MIFFFGGFSIFGTHDELKEKKDDDESRFGVKNWTNYFGNH